jgi:hypothetical protein
VAAGVVRDRASLARLARTFGIAGAVALVLAFGLPALLGHEPLRALATALAIHRADYTAPRSYARWLAWNPLDFALFAGLPVALLAAWTAAASRRGTSPPTSLDRFRIALFGGLVALVLLGVTRGEAGRLWVPLVPLVLLASARDDESPTALGALAPAAIAAAFSLAIASCWSF